MPTTDRRDRTSSLGVLVLAAVLCAAALLVYYRFVRTPAGEPASTAGEAIGAAANREQFVAMFDSLAKTSLFLVVSQTRAFTKSEFTNDFSRWTLTTSSATWGKRGEGDKRDLAARVWVAFQGARAQAGGDPDAGTLVIKDERKRVVARCTSQLGCQILE